MADEVVTGPVETSLGPEQNEAVAADVVARRENDLDTPRIEPQIASARAEPRLSLPRTGPRLAPPRIEPRPAPEPPMLPAPDAAAAEDGRTRINDDRFIKDLNRLKDLRSFLIQEAVVVAASDSRALEFGRLNQLQYNMLNDGRGRDPTPEEWSQVEWRTRVLFGLLTPALRRRFVLGAVPGMLAWLPLILALVALAALILAIKSYNTDFLRMGSIGANALPFYLVWLMSLGAIGAIAFIGMNALSVQEDITFDLTNRRLIIMRIGLGALFGLVLTLPFGFQGFLDFCHTIVAGGEPSPAQQAGQSPPPTVTIQALMLVLPFVLGFSTSLVILILNRFVDAVQGFFGRKPADSAAATPPVATAVRL